MGSTVARTQERVKEQKIANSSLGCYYLMSNLDISTAVLKLTAANSWQSYSSTYKNQLFFSVMIRPQKESSLYQVIYSKSTEVNVHITL